MNKTIFICTFLLAIALICSIQAKKPKKFIINNIRKIGVGVLTNPESIVFDEEGFLYTTLNDGSIAKVNVTSGESSKWAYVVPNLTPEQRATCGQSVLNEQLCGRGLGMTWDKTGEYLLVCDAYHGIKKIKKSDPTQVTTLIDSIEGVKMKFSNSIIASKDGETIYFTDSSLQYYRYQFLAALLKYHPDGRLIRFNMRTQETTVLVNGLRFANGIAFGKKEKNIIINECANGKVHKYYLKGSKAGKLKLINKNIGGYVDNIRPDNNGAYYEGIFGPITNGIAAIQSDQTLSDLALQYIPPLNLIGMIKSQGIIKKINRKGKVIAEIIDPTGTVLKAVAEAEFHHNKLYIGSVINNFLGVIDLDHDIVPAEE